MFPAQITEAVEESLRKAGDPGPIRDITPLAGGDINRAVQLETANSRYFVKWHASPPPEFFECEARGLELLRDARAARVPSVISADHVPHEQTAYLILEYIEPGPRMTTAARALGRQLALQHLAQQPHYGLDHDNYIGRLPQPNQPGDSWIDFYRNQRLAAQRDLAARSGYLTRERARNMDKLLDRLDDWLSNAETQPALIHGDLWGGNWMADASGSPVLIDPAVYFADREVDLAMTRLFGGYPPDFYEAYREVYPLAPGWEDRELLYQLYYLLVHLNLFGEAYGASVDSVLRRTVGQA